MKRCRLATLLTVVLAVVMSQTAPASPQSALSGPHLRELAAAAGIQVGAAVQAAYIASDPQYLQTLTTEYSSLTPENEMKWLAIHPARDVFNFAVADGIVRVATQSDMDV